MKLNLLLVLLLASIAACGQDSLQQQRSIVTFNLFSPVVSLAPRWNVGYIYKVNTRWWAGLEAGYGTYGLTINNSDNGDDFVTEDYKLWELRPQIYYDLRPNKKLKHLLSLELFYINHQDRFTTDDYFQKEDSRTYRYDSADYKRIKTGFNINYNTLYYFSNRLVLWQQIGVGLRNRNASYSNITNKTLKDTTGNDEGHGGEFGMRNYIEEEGSYMGFNFNMNFKLAYTF